MSGRPSPDRESELVDRIRLSLLPGLGDRRLARLLDRHGSCRAVLRAPPGELGENANRALGSPRFERRVRRCRQAVHAHDIRVLLRGEASYPDSLLQLDDPPNILFARGRLELVDRAAVAIVGTRRSSVYGAQTSEMLSAGAARSGVVVVSGLAHGIDTEVHAAALEGGTIAVLGCGIDVYYPAPNRHLQEEIAASGLLLSEFPPGTPPLRHHFPRRNRIIAALARAVVVVEAPHKSGALITAEHGKFLNRDICAVPGPIGRGTSDGCNALLRDGATFITSVDDLLDVLGSDTPDPASSAREAAVEGTVPAAARPVWRNLTREPAHLDTVAEAAGVRTGKAMQLLLELELSGHVEQYPGQRFVRK